MMDFPLNNDGFYTKHDGFYSNNYGSQAAELMKSSAEKEEEEGGGYIPPHKRKGGKKKSKGVSLSLEELGFLFSRPSDGLSSGSGGYSSSSDSWKHDQYRGVGGGGGDMRSGGGDRDRMNRDSGYSNSSGRDLGGGGGRCSSRDSYGAGGRSSSGR